MRSVYKKRMPSTWLLISGGHCDGGQYAWPIMALSRMRGLWHERAGVQGLRASLIAPHCTHRAFPSVLCLQPGPSPVVTAPHPTVVWSVMSPSVHLRKVFPACGHATGGPPSSPSATAAFLPSLSWSEHQLGGGAHFIRCESCPQSYGNVTVLGIYPNTSAHSAQTQDQTAFG